MTETYVASETSYTIKITKRVDSVQHNNFIISSLLILCSTLLVDCIIYKDLTRYFGSRLHSRASNTSMLDEYDHLLGNGSVNTA
jgi:hypothetical protein